MSLKQIRMGKPEITTESYNHICSKVFRVPYQITKIDTMQVSREQEPPHAEVSPSLDRMTMCGMAIRQQNGSLAICCGDGHQSMEYLYWLPV